MDGLVELEEDTYTIRVDIRPDTDEQIEAIEDFIQATPEERARLLSLGLVTSSIMAQVMPAILIVGEAHRYAAS